MARRKGGRVGAAQAARRRRPLASLTDAPLCIPPDREADPGGIGGVALAEGPVGLPYRAMR